MIIKDKLYRTILDAEIKRINKEISIFFVYGTEIVRMQKEKHDDVMDTRNMFGVLSITKRKSGSKMPKMYIWIRKGYDYLLPWRLYHEYGHFKCIKKGCYCIDKALINDGEYINCEHHANMFALNQVLKITKKMDATSAYLVLFFTTLFIEEEIKAKKSKCPIHKKSLLKTSKTKIYRNILKLRNSLARKHKFMIQLDR
jgi:hypothetical protein